MTIWFSSDLHLGHRNIIEYCGRPFNTTREMDEALLTWHNELVKPSDHWYNLGDVTMDRGGKERQDLFIAKMKRFNGHKRLLMGNHDHFPIKTYIAAGFEKIYGTHRLDRYILSHIPLHNASITGVKANIHGHIHNNQSGVFKPALWVDRNGVTHVVPYINLSVETINYRPVSLEQIHEMVRQATT